jgi:hypothetical protein
MPKIWQDREYDTWQYSDSEEVAGKISINADRMQKTLFDNLTGNDTNAEFVTIRLKPETIADLKRALNDLGRVTP